jgi:hypothetical protein
MLRRNGDDFLATCKVVSDKIIVCEPTYCESFFRSEIHNGVQTQVENK